jgi:hypothetical protein
MRNVTIVLLVLAAGVARGIGSTPFRIDVLTENGYARGCVNLTANGMVDINRRVALRLCLLNAWVSFSPYDAYRVRLGAPEALGISGFNETEVLYSPFRDRWRVEPYIHGGFGFDCSRSVRGDTTRSRTALEVRFGLGAERLLFFLKKAPSLFVENAMVLGGESEVLHMPSRFSFGRPSFPELKMEQVLRVGIRI